MTTTIRCPSHSPVEICAVLGFSGGRDGLTILDGCGYCDDSGQCHYRGGLHRKEHREPGVPEYRREQRRQRRRGQVSLHAFLGRC